MTKKYIFGLLLLWTSQSFSLTNKDSLFIIVAGKSKSYSLHELKRKLKVSSISGYDPVYKQQKTFDGFHLKDVIELAGPIPTDLDEITFEASDGYAPSINVKEAFATNALVAFQEKGLKNNFSKAQSNSKVVDLRPYYLVWEGGEKVPHYYPRPYQMVKIELVKFKEKFKNLYPDALDSAEQAKKGFLLFKGECFRCHSINGTGGTLGPELNSPNNVTDYWVNDKLKGFIKDATAFRANSKMPSFKDMSDESIEQILSYLKFIKSYKNSP